MRYLLALVIIIGLLPLIVVQSTKAVVNEPQAPLNTTLCLVDLSGLPIPVRFEESISLTQAIRQAEIPRERMKDEVTILRRQENRLLQFAKVNLKRIEKGAIADFRLDQHDMVFVMPKKNETPADLESIGRGCVTCGCRPMAGMHGSFIVPKEWGDSSLTPKDDFDPNNKKP